MVPSYPETALEKTLQRAVIGLGIVAAIGVVWLAQSRQRVGMDAFLTRLEERRAELEAMLSHPPDSDVDRDARMEGAIAAGARIRVFENSDSSQRGPLSSALGRMAGRRHGEFTSADRDRILAHPAVSLGLKQLGQGGGSSTPASGPASGLAYGSASGPGAEALASLGRENYAEFSLLRLIDYLALSVASSADSGDEEGVVAGFERLMRVSEDCYERRDSVLTHVGNLAFKTALRSAHEMQRLNVGFETIDAEWPFFTPAMERMLASVPSAAGRQRLVAAIDQTQAWVPTVRDGAIFDFLNSADDGLDYMDFEYRGSALIPARWMDDLEDAIRWQEEALIQSDDPELAITDDFRKATWRDYERLSQNAQLVAGYPWGFGHDFVRIQDLGDQAKGWLVAGSAEAVSYR